MNKSEAEVPAFLVDAFEGLSRPAEMRQEHEMFQSIQALLGSSSPQAADLRPRPVARLLEDVAEAPICYAPFFAKVAEMFGTSEAQVEELLGPNGWKKAPFPGIELKEFRTVEGDPDLSQSVVRFSAGTRFPRHGHKHHERLLILEGGYTDDTGQRFSAGDLHEMPPGSQHAFVVDPEGPCVAVSVADRHLKFSSLWLRALSSLVGR